MAIKNEIMKAALEVKAKLMSPSGNQSMVLLEKEWAKYKYLILAKNPNGYKQIRQLLKDKSSYPVKAFYDIVDVSLQAEQNIGYETNAAQHVFGYFKRLASAEEKKKAMDIIERYSEGKAPLSDVKGELKILADKYDVQYLRNSYYFCDD